MSGCSARETPPLRPRLVPELLVAPCDGGLLFLGGREPQLIGGRDATGLLAALLPLLDGRRTVDALAEQLRCERGRVASVVGFLHARRLVEEAQPDETSPSISAGAVEAFAARLGSAGTRLERRRRLADTHVAVAGRGSHAAPIVSLLAQSGLGRVTVHEASLPPPAPVLVLLEERDGEWAPDVVQARPELLILLGRKQMCCATLAAGECLACIGRSASRQRRPSAPDAWPLLNGLAAHCITIILTGVAEGARAVCFSGERSLTRVELDPTPQRSCSACAGGRASA